MVNRQKALIHIGGSKLQVPTIHWAKELGLYVILTDRNPDAPGPLLADHFELIDGTDLSSLFELAHRVNCEYELVGAYASNDFGLPAVAKIGELLGQPSCSQLAVERALDKSVCKDIWRRENLATPEGVIVKDRKDLFSAVDELGLPVIVKPTNSSGSQGVCSVWYTKDLEQAYTAAKLFSDSVLVEQLIGGHHIDVNGLFVEGEFLPCGTMDRFFSEAPYHYPVWGCQPSSLDATKERAVCELVERAARVLGIEVGPVKADIVWTDGGPVILELAPRFHGDVSTAYVTPMATGSSPIKAWLAYLMGAKNPLEHLEQKAYEFAGWMALFPTNSGKLLSIEGIEEVRAMESIKNIFIASKIGRSIKKAKDNSAVCGFIWAKAENHSEVLEKLNKARSTIRFMIE